ncbi:MAG: PGF-CTERM sorting domain-containing protein [Halobacteria archaeon]|nr:PGF-CTERM sorting domain-containing protein [Halobacteria archaeon]
MRRKASLILCIALVTSILSVPVAAAHSGSHSSGSSGSLSDVEFMRNVEEIRGHLHASLHFSEQGNTDEAVKHAKHAPQGYWNVIGPSVKSANSTFSNTLKLRLAELPDTAANASYSEYKSYVNNKVRPLLGQAVQEVVPQEKLNSTKFHAEVVAALLDRISGEYGVAMSNGTVKKLGEYWDARGFIVRVQSVYKNEISSSLKQENAKEISEILESLESSIKSKAAPSKIQSTVNSAKHELAEYTGIEVSTGDTSGSTISKIKSNLDKVVQEYEEGENAEAKKIISNTYLTMFEGIEGPLIEERPELVEELEKAFNKELPSLIDNNASIKKVEAKVNGMKQKLDEAAKVLNQKTEETEDVFSGNESSDTSTEESKSTGNESMNGTGDGGSGGNGLPGFTVVVALAALVAVAALVRRR